ncbi:MAG: cysteate synthase [Rikenellaceae bacterium]
MASGFLPTQYQLMCVETLRKFNDEGWMLDDPQSPKPSLVRALYKNSQLNVGDESLGLYKFADWLPINRTLKGSAAPLTYKSEKLAAKLSLDNLYITISGYFPQVGANFQTCSFKETEAYSVCGRMDSNCEKVLVVASAGNTARAFAKVCSENKIPLLLVVPHASVGALWFKEPIDERYVKLIVSQEGSDYFDAINLSNIVVEHSSKFYAEGGAKNVARRDGMGTTFLSATTFIGEIPDYYFQAIGSGTGAIAAWEANMRLVEDGRFGNKIARHILSQNAPFLVMYDAWKASSRALLPFDDDTARKAASEIDAIVLSNRRPPYSLSGGVFDTLSATNGDVRSITNEKAKIASELFEECEGVDIDNAAAVAVASLIEAVESGEIEKDKIVMVNITGAGAKLMAKEHDLCGLKPCAVFANDASVEEIISKVESLWE